MRRFRRFDAVEGALVVGFVAVVAWVAMAPLTPARYVAKSLVGRVDPRCTLSLVRAAERRQAERTAAINAARHGVARTEDDAYRTPLGLVWTSPRDLDPTSTAAAFYGTRTLRWVRADGVDGYTVRAGDIVIDAGAHVGESTYAALELGAARVVAIEPDPENLAALKRNLARPIADGRVLVVEKGVYDRIGTLSFERAISVSGHFEEAAEGGVLPITTIDAVVDELGLARVDFIKMDIEGSEVPALRGARDTLRRFAPRMTVGTYHRDGDLELVEQTVLGIRSDYRALPSLCLDTYVEHRFDEFFPMMLYFDVE